MKFLFIWLLPLVFLLGCSDSETAPTAIANVNSSAGSDQGSSADYFSLIINEEQNQWWHSAIFYEIWPRSFQDSDGDGSGDFNGMTNKLDYLQGLGVNGIWLTPVFEAPSYHGYDFQDFYNVEADYGTMADF